MLRAGVLNGTDAQPPPEGCGAGNGAGWEASPSLERAILAFAREHLAAFKVPRSIDFEDALPRDVTGKLYTRRLREPYWRGRAAKI